MHGRALEELPGPFKFFFIFWESAGLQAQRWRRRYFCFKFHTIQLSYSSMHARLALLVHTKYVSIYVTKCRDMCVHSIKVRMTGHTLQLLYRVHGKWLFRVKWSYQTQHKSELICYRLLHIWNLFINICFFQKKYKLYTFAKRFC